MGYAPTALSFRRVNAIVTRPECPGNVEVLDAPKKINAPAVSGQYKV
jgi:hypothetical protein